MKRSRRVNVQRRLNTVEARLDRLPPEQRHVLQPLFARAKVRGRVVRSIMDSAPWLMPLIEASLHLLVCVYGLAHACYSTNPEMTYASFLACCTKFTMQAFWKTMRTSFSWEESIRLMVATGGGTRIPTIADLLQVFRRSIAYLQPLVDRLSPLVWPIVDMAIEATTLDASAWSDLSGPHAARLRRALVSFAGGMVAPHLYRVFRGYSVALDATRRPAPQWKRDAFRLAMVLRWLCGEWGDTNDARAYRPLCHSVALLAQSSLFAEIVVPRLLALADVTEHACL